MRLAVLVALVLAAAQPSLAAELVVDPTLTTMVEYDSNARRQAVAEDATADKAAVGDALIRSRAGLRVQTEAVGGRLYLDGVIGLKRFFTEEGQSMAVGQIWASWTRRLPWSFTLTTSQLAKARGQVSLARTYALGRTDVDLSRPLWFGFLVSGGLAITGFSSADNPLFSSLEATPRLGLSFFFTDREQIDATFNLGSRAFPLLSSIDPDGNATGMPRIDGPLRFQVAIRSARSLYLSARYTFTRNWSTSTGDSFTRHRVDGAVGLRLPLEITVTGQAALQITSYDNGLSVGQRLFLADDDESQNTVSVAISRPLWWGIHTEGRLAYFGNEFARERLSFGRTTASVGIRWEL